MPKSWPRTPFSGTRYCIAPCAPHCYITEEPKELTIVNIAGKINMDQLRQLQGHLGVPYMPGTVGGATPAATPVPPVPPAAPRQTTLVDCSYLEYVTKKVLPLFTTRSVKLISPADCAKIKVGLSAQVLMPPQQVATSPQNGPHGVSLSAVHIKNADN